jgi:CRISPR-associated protein Csd1
MSWLTMLYETYNNVVGALDGPLPIAHTTQNADVEVTIDIDGNFVSSRVVEFDRQTLIPCSESSASRSGKNPVPHPLHDKLQYVAGDYTKFGGEKGEGFHRDYMAGLGEWCKSPYANPKVCAVYKYLTKGSLIDDLIKGGVLIMRNNKFLEKWDGGRNEKPPIFKVITGNQVQSDAFVRFCVIRTDDNIINLWQDRKLQEDFINFYLSKQRDKNLCYATGQIVPCSTNHPSKIRHTGDKAKLISANDESGFTYRGRFDSSKSAVQVSYEVSQKAHNALKWLIQKQGKNFGGKVFLLWGTNNEKLPCVTGDTFDEAYLFVDEPDLRQEKAYTKEEIAKRFNMAISGYKADLSSKTKLSLIALDAATTGRLSITFYREFHGEQGNELFDRIQAWHNLCAWHHRYKFVDKKLIVFDGAPALDDIATAAFGTEQGEFIKGNSKVIGKTVERLLPCIIDGADIPSDIVNSLVRKAFYPQNYNNEFNWNKVVSIACAVTKKYRFDRFKEVWNVSVDKESTDIVYNCGRLLAVADAIERFALSLKDEKRETSAIRYFTRFAAAPCKTWGIINNKLNIYIQQLGAKGNKYYKLMGEISSKIPPEQFATLRNLDGRMVLGFDAQRNEIRWEDKS